MQKFIQQNHIAIIIVLIAVIIISYNKKDGSLSEIYKINSDCSEKATLFAKNKSDEFESWEVRQSLFKKDSQSCFAQFSVWRSISKSRTDFIYDLTHTKELVWKPDFKTGDDVEIYGEYVKNYQKVEKDIFGISR